MPTEMVNHDFWVCVCEGVSGRRDWHLQTGKEDGCPQSGGGGEGSLTEGQIEQKVGRKCMPSA